MCEQEKAIVVASGDGALIVSMTEKLWTVTEVPDIHTLSPVTVKTVEKFTADLLTFYTEEESGEMVMTLENEEGSKYDVYGITGVSPFKIKTEKGNFLISPPTRATPWIMTKTSQLGASLIARTEPWIEGASIRIERGTFRLLGARGREEFKAEVEKLI